MDSRPDRLKVCTETCSHFQEKTEERFDKVNGRLDKVEGRLDLVARGLRGLRADMPKIVGTAMREVLSGRKRKS